MLMSILTSNFISVLMLFESFTLSSVVYMTGIGTSC